MFLSNRHCFQFVFGRDLKWSSFQIPTRLATRTRGVRVTRFTLRCRLDEFDSHKADDAQDFSLDGESFHLFLLFFLIEKLVCFCFSRRATLRMEIMNNVADRLPPLQMNTSHVETEENHDAAQCERHN